MENDALKDLMQSMAEEESEAGQEENLELETEVKEEEAQDEKLDYKALFEAYKNENDAKLGALMQELEALKQPKEVDENALQRQAYLKELGLEGLDEKLKRLEELDLKQREKEAQDALSLKYAQVESELRKAYPDADLKEMAELATKLNGLSEGDITSWKTLLNLVGKTQAKKAEDLANTSHNTRTSDFNEKLKKGEVSEIDLGKELLSLM